MHCLLAVELNTTHRALLIPSIAKPDLELAESAITTACQEPPTRTCFSPREIEVRLTGFKVRALCTSPHRGQDPHDRQTACPCSSFPGTFVHYAAPTTGRVAQGPEILFQSFPTSSVIRGEAAAALPRTRSQREASTMFHRCSSGHYSRLALGTLLPSRYPVLRVLVIARILHIRQYIAPLSGVIEH